MARAKFYAKLTDEELKLVDEIVETLEYETRTDFITALLHAAIYGTDIGRTEIQAMYTSVTAHDTLRSVFFAILDEYAFPILAMRGVEYTCRSLKDDYRNWMYERCHTVPDTADLEKWTRLYYAIKKGDIRAYRTQIVTATYQAEHGIETPEALS